MSSNVDIQTVDIYIKGCFNCTDELAVQLTNKIIKNLKTTAYANGVTTYQNVTFDRFLDFIEVTNSNYVLTILSCKLWNVTSILEELYEIFKHGRKV